MTKKVKKMAFGGAAAAGRVANRPTTPAQGALGGNQAPAGANLMQKYNGPPSAPPTQSRMQQMQPMGGLGGNQAPAGADLLKAYNAQGSGSAPPPANPNMQNAFQAFNQQKNMGAPTTTNPPNRLTSVNPRDLKQIGVKAGLMKKGGAVKTKKYAKGGAIKSSASSRGDGIATKGKTRGRIV